MIRKLLAFTVFIWAAVSSPADARDQIRIVGSSTVFPFATTVAERFGRASGFKTPIVESTGSGGGLKLFCAGVGDGYPDIANASRRIKKSEFKQCAKNNITDIVEVKIGYDGIVLANSTRSDRMELSLRDIYMALTKQVPAGDGKFIDNPFKTWEQVNPDLPAIKIKVLGPPPTSGTRDAFVELAMEGGCMTFPWIEALKKTDKERYKAVCHGLREDGAYVEAGENDNLIIQKLETNPKSLGIFGFSFLDQNADKVHGVKVAGVEPTFVNISSGTYPVSRSLYMYVKKIHVGKIPGIEEYLAEFSSDRAMGDEGYLADKGLIPMTPSERKIWNNKTKNLAKLEL